MDRFSGGRWLGCSDLSSLAAASRMATLMASLMATLVGVSLPAWATGLPPCATFTSCTAVLASDASYYVRRDVNASPGYVMDSSLVQGSVVRQDGDSTLTSAAALARDGVPNIPPFIISPWAMFAKATAQTDFGVNRALTSTGSGVTGVDSQAVGSAAIDLFTTATASSIWRDVWGFSAPGHFAALLTVDGTSSLAAVGGFPASYQFNPRTPAGDWFMDLRVWDVTHLSVSEDYEQGGPTPVARSTLRGNGEQRATFHDSLALDFDFLVATQYVITAELRATSYHGRELDVFNTARLLNVQLGGGAVLTALSGHDYVAAVPEPGQAAMVLAGLACLAFVGARRRTSLNPT